MPLSFIELLEAMLDFSSLTVSVEAEGVREKVFARGPRCVSLSSSSRIVSNLDLEEGVPMA
jgi:hypothetical protein